MRRPPRPARANRRPGARLAAALLLLCAAGTLGACASRRPTPEADARELMRLQVEVARAADTRNAALLKDLMTDDFVITFQAGEPPDVRFRYSDKTRTIAHWTAPQPGVESLPTTVEEQRAQVSGDTGVVFARITDRWRDREGEHAAVTWVSDTWVRRAGHWRWFAAHESLIR